MGRLETARDEFLTYKREGSQERRPCAVTTLRTYRQALQSFIDWMTVEMGAKATTLRFSTAVVRRYLDHRAGTRNMSGHTVSLDSTVLREFARWGARQRYWQRDDVDDIPRIDKPKTLPRPYRAAERDRLLALPLEAPDRVLRALLYYAGLRASETTALRLRDITPPHDLPTGQTIPGRLYVWGKGAKERPVAIHAALWRELEAYLSTLPAGTKLDRRLLVKGNGDPWTHKMVLLHVKAWAAAAGVSTPKPHRFRHSFATDLVESGADVFTVQKLLGHARTETTAIYVEASEQRKAEAVGRLPDYLPVAPQPEEEPR
jgi:integrase/recombinase XerC